MVERALKESRFSYERLESIMMITETSWDELEAYTGYHNIAHISRRNGLPRNIVQLCGEYMECDPRYLLMEVNEPNIGKYKGFKVVVEPQTPKEEPRKDRKPAPSGKKPVTEINRIDTGRFKEVADAQGWQQKTMAYFVDSAPSDVSVYSQILRRKTVYKHTTENLAWMLGVTVKYLCGDTDDPKDGSVAKRHRTAKETFILNATSVSTGDLMDAAGVSERMALWLKENHRVVNYKLAERIAKHLGCQVMDLSGDSQAKRIADGTLPEIPAKTAKPEKAPKPAPVKEEPRNQGTNTTPAEAPKPAATPKKKGAAMSGVTDALKGLPNESLEAVKVFVGALKKLDAPVSNEDLIKLEVFIDALKNLNDAADMLA